MTAAVAARAAGAECAQGTGTQRWLQRKGACGGSAGLTGHCSECERKKALGLQAKLAVGAAHDPLEEESDRVADQVTRPPVARPCGPRAERLTLAHEQIHSVHARELQQRHRRGTRAFRTAFNEAGDWAADEINSRRTDIAVANWMMDVLNRACP
jgi:hypothetical protein